MPPMRDISPAACPAADCIYHEHLLTHLYNTVVALSDSKTTSEQARGGGSGCAVEWEPAACMPFLGSVFMHAAPASGQVLGMCCGAIIEGNGVCACAFGGVARGGEDGASCG